MLKLFAVSLVIINSSLVASEPEKSAKTAAFLDRIHKCEVRELAVQGGKDSPSITEKLLALAVTSGYQEADVTMNRCLKNVIPIQNLPPCLPKNIAPNWLRFHRTLTMSGFNEFALFIICSNSG